MLVERTTLNSNLIVNNGTTTLKNRLNVTNGGLSVEAGGLTVSAGGLTVSAGGLTVNAGDTTLANKLTVSSGGLTVSNGGLNITGDTILNGSTAIIRANSGSLNLQTGTTDRIIIDTDGNVGIAGPVNSSYKLNVTGATNLTSTLSVTGGTTLGSTLGVTGLSTLASLSVTNNATIGGTLGVTGLSTLASLSVTNNATIGGTLGVTGATNLTSSLNVTGATTLGQNSSSTDTTVTTVNGKLTMNGNASGNLSAYNTSTTNYQGGFYNSTIGTGNGIFLSSRTGITEIKMNNSGYRHFTISNDSTNSFKINNSTNNSSSYTNDKTLLTLTENGALTIIDKLTVNNGGLTVSAGETTLANKLTVNSGGLAVVGPTTLGQSGSNTSTTVNGKIINNYTIISSDELSTVPTIAWIKTAYYQVITVSTSSTTGDNAYYMNVKNGSNYTLYYSLASNANGPTDIPSIHQVLFKTENTSANPKIYDITSQGLNGGHDQSYAICFDTNSYNSSTKKYSLYLRTGDNYNALYYDNGNQQSTGGFYKIVLKY